MILCCGEALVDLIPDGKTRIAHAGGAVFNTAIALGRLGADAALLTGLSIDEHGVLLRDTLVASGVSTRYAVESDRFTTRAVVHLNGDEATYEFEDEGSALRMLSPDDMPTIGPEVAALFLGGISLCALPVADTLVGFAQANAKGRLVMVDPNIRPGFITDEPAYRKRLARLLSISHVVKVSADDLAWLYPDKTLREQIAALHGQGPAVVLLTRGGDGASAFWAGKEAHAAAPKVTTVDTIGAGDTFNAGFLSQAEQEGLLSPQAMVEADVDALTRCLSLGARAAAVTVSRPGADPPTREELPG